jgi:cold shock CspA family protein
LGLYRLAKVSETIAATVIIATAVFAQSIVKLPAIRGTTRRSHRTCIEDDTLPTGIVRWFDEEKGYGIISQTAGDPEIFVYMPEVERAGFSELLQGQIFSYDIKVDWTGRISAVNLKVACVSDNTDKQPIMLRAGRWRSGGDVLTPVLVAAFVGSLILVAIPGDQTRDALEFVAAAVGLW